MSVPGLKGTVRVAFAGDTHLGLRDARDDEHADFYARMAQYASKGEALEKTLKKCAERKTDLVALLGDTLSFPTLANAEFAERTMKASGLEWIYTAGNHDWHFEGDGGSDMEQRERWTKKRLMGLYPAGANPLAHSRVVKGLRVVAIDNSTYEMLPEQTEFWRAEAAKGEPVVLMMHIPLWTEGWGVFTCGSPEWGAARDEYWKIERRQRWAERASAATMEFRRAVLETPNLAGVFTGHYHSTMVAVEGGKLMASVESNGRGKYLEVDFAG